MKIKSFQSNLLKFIVISSSAIASISFYLTPYLTILGFKNALDSENYHLASRYINFISLRDSLKDQLKKPLESKLLRQFNSSNYAPLVQLIARPVAENLIEATISPKGLELLLRYGKLSSSDRGMSSYAATHEEVNSSTNIDLFYVGINQFAIASYTDLSDQPIIALWHREGIISWKLTSLQIPNEILAVYY